MIERLSLLIGRVATVSLADYKREDGQTTVEYAVVVTLVIVMAIAAFAALQTGVSDFMTKIEGYLTSAAGSL